MPCVHQLEQEVRRLEEQLRMKQVELERARKHQRKEEEAVARRREMERVYKALVGDEPKVRREVCAAERSGRVRLAVEHLLAQASRAASSLEAEHVRVLLKAAGLTERAAAESTENSLRRAAVTVETSARKDLRRAQQKDACAAAQRAVRDEAVECSGVVVAATAAEEKAKVAVAKAVEKAPAPTTRIAAEAISTEELARLMLQARDVRNVVVIAHVDAGKTTLTDALLARGGVIAESRAGSACHMDSGVEQERGITIKAASVSLAFRTAAAPSGTCVMNLIDSPGHADFNAEVTTAMRVSDGALVVVDAVEGVQVQTEVVLQQALQERVVPCLVVNKADRLLCRLRQSPEDTYQRLMCAVEGVGRIVRDSSSEQTSAACRAALRRRIDPRPEDGSVAFTCGKDGWGFTIMTFARLMEARTGVPATKTAKLFWGDNFWNPKARKWSSNATDAEGRALPRGFCHFVLRPLLAILTGCQEGAWSVVEQEVDKLWPGRWAAGVLSPEERKNEGEAVFALLMRRLLPAADALVELAAGRLPAPCVAQEYRADILCEEDAEGDEALQAAVRNCNPDGPLIFYVTKLVPVQRTWGFYAFGRVLSGRLRAGAAVQVLGHGGQHVRKVALLMARKEMSVTEVPAGSLAAAVGLDGAQLKTATVVEPSLSRARPLRGIRHSVSPVVRSAVQLVAPSEQPQLVKALQWLQRSDPLVQCEIVNGQCVIAAGGELHLELCIRSLQERMEGPPGASSGSSKGLKVARPAVAHQETVRAEGPSCLAKSPAKLNRVWMAAGPMDHGLADALERGEIPTGHSEADTIQRVRALVETWGWSRDEARSVWAVRGSNILVDFTKGIQYLDDARPHITSAFEQVVSAGPVCGEPLRGVVFRLTDAKLHGDKHHRGPAELLPAASRALKAAMLRDEAQPGLFEPVFRCTISTVADAAGVVRGEMPRRRGSVEDEQHTDGGRVVLDGLLPVATSFGLADALRAQTGGRAFASCSFDSWRMMAGNPRPPAPATRGSRASEPQAAAATVDLCLSAVRECRLRNSLKGDAPTAVDYEDRL